MVRINLLPVRVSKKKERGKQELILYALIVVIGLVGNWMWNSGRSTDLSGRQRTLAKTQADVQALERIIGEVASIKTEQKALQEKLAVLDTLKKGRSGPVRVLDELATMMPKRVSLRKMTEKGGKVSFDGVAGTIDDVSAFLGALKQSTHFKDADLKKTEAKSQGGLKTVDFLIEATVDYTADVTKTADAPTPGATPRTGG
jgi:type IV pilus assembly protein PilN